MSDISNKQKVEGGALLDAIASLFFKGLDNIFDAAVEYQKEMGVLKQVNKIKVADNEGNEYTLTVKLSPIRDKQSVFFVEVECDAPDFNIPDEVNKKAYKIANDNKKEFSALIEKILTANKLQEVKSDEDADEGESEAKEVDEPKFTKEDLNSYRFGPFYFSDDKAEKLEYKVFIEMKGDTQDDKFVITVVSDPKLRFNYLREFAFDDNSPNIKASLVSFFKKCGVSADSNDFEDTMQTLEDKYADYVDDITASSAIHVRLEKVAANGHQDINLISIYSSTYTRRSALKVVQEIVASDEFVDDMPEGESDYEITEDDDFFNIEQV